MSPCYRAIVSRGRVNMTKLLFDVTDWTKMPHDAPDSPDSYRGGRAAAWVRNERK